MFRMLEDAGDHEVLLQKRINARERRRLHIHALTHAESPALDKLLLYGALIRRLGQTPLQQLRQGDLPRRRQDQNRLHGVAQGQSGVDLIQRLRFFHAGQRTDSLKILVVHQHGGVDLKVPEAVTVVVVLEICLNRGCRVGNAEIGHHRDHGNHDDGDEGDELFFDIAPGVFQLCLCHRYQTSSDAWSGCRLILMLETLPFLSLTMRLAILAISGLWVIMTTVAPCVLMISSKTVSTSMLV